LSKAKTTALGIIIVLAISCLIMYYVETSSNGYLIKSLWKIGAFALLPLLYSLFDKQISLPGVFKIDSKKQIYIPLILGAAVYLFIFSGYLLLSGFINLENIASLLSENVNINRENFVFVALYISFINSFLEEFFFRGFGFLSLKKVLHPCGAYIISALAFSLYHVAILANWFSPWLFILIISGLFVAGVFFNRLDAKSKNIYNSWLVHMFANFSINTVGFIMFGII
jgi:membrane protease YdiL (CAAX protease family)